jgi:hypothetical protein
MPKSKEVPNCKGVPWGKSDGKALLMKDLRNGSIPLDNTLLSAHEIAATRPEFGDSCDPDNMRLFKARLERARKSVSGSRNRAALDKVMVEHDIMLFQQKRAALCHNVPMWHGSKAEVSLKVDIDNHMHTKMKPPELYKTRPEYGEFSFKVFRGHISQEVKTRKFRKQYADRKAKR